MSEDKKYWMVRGVKKKNEKAKRELICGDRSQRSLLEKSYKKGVIYMRGCCCDWCVLFYSFFLTWNGGSLDFSWIYSTQATLFWIRRRSSSSVVCSANTKRKKRRRKRKGGQGDTSRETWSIRTYGRRKESEYERREKKNVHDNRDGERKWGKMEKIYKAPRVRREPKQRAESMEIEMG